MQWSWVCGLVHLPQLARVRMVPPDRSESRQVSISVQLHAVSSHAPPLLSLLPFPSSEATPGVGSLDRQHAPVLHFSGLAANFLPCQVVDVWGAFCVQGAHARPSPGTAFTVTVWKSVISARSWGAPCALGLPLHGAPLQLSIIGGGDPQEPFWQRVTSPII